MKIEIYSVHLVFYTHGNYLRQALNCDCPNRWLFFSYMLSIFMLIRVTKKRKKIGLPRMCVTSWHCQYRVYKIFNCKQSVFLMSLYLQGVYLVKHLMALNLKAMMSIVVMMKRKKNKPKLKN